MNKRRGGGCFFYQCWAVTRCR